MNADRAVDELGDVHVAAGAHEHVSVPSGHVLHVDEQCDRLAHRGLRGDGEAAVGPHGDPVRRRLTTRPREVHVLPHHELEPAAERRFQCGDVDLAVTLGGVAVSDFEQRAGDLHRDVEDRPGDQLAVVEVPRMRTWRGAVDALQIVHI